MCVLCAHHAQDEGIEQALAVMQRQAADFAGPLKPACVPACSRMHGHDCMAASIGMLQCVSRMS